LNAKGLVGAVAYTDGQFDDARYNIALVQKFSEADGEALNYARVIGFGKRGDGKIETAEIEDQLSGRRFAVGARAIVNATGAFADTIREMASPGMKPRMRLSRGVHILLPLEVLAGEQAAAKQSGGAASAHECDALLVPKTEDGRVLFAIPWMGRLLVGTTDEEVKGVEQRGVTEAEVEYLLRHLNRHLAKEVKRGEIVGGFAGVRPLVTATELKRSRKPETKSLARDHEVEADRASGLISIMGGKWTTYRAMAEDTINAVERYLGRKVTPCRTSEFPLAGSDGFTGEYWRSLVQEFGITEASAKHLAEKFGTSAAEVMAVAKENPQLMATLAEGLAPLAAEVVFCVRQEMASSIDDILARRIGLEFYGWREAMAAAPAVADLLGAELGWSPEERQKELRKYIARIKEQMIVTSHEKKQS